MEQFFTFKPSIAKNMGITSKSSTWQNAQKLFNEKKYLDSFYETLNYIDPDLIKTYGNAAKTEFSFPQGSAVVIIKLIDDVIDITAPFVKIPPTKFLPIFRKCIELNYNVMTLPQIVIKDDYLVFKYKMPLETCEPYKFYSVLRDIAQNADKYDDEFIEKFGAQRVMEPLVTHYSDTELSDALQHCKLIANETLSYVSFYEGKRDFEAAYDSLYIGLNRLEYYCKPSGMLQSQVFDSLDALYNKNFDMVAKLKPGKQFLQKMESLTIDKFKESCFISYSLISIKRSANREFLQEWVNKYHYERIDSMLNKGDYLGSALSSGYALYTMLAGYKLDHNSTEAIEYALKHAEGKSWQEAAERLMEVIDFFADNEEDRYEATANVDMTDNSAYAEQMKAAMSGYQSALNSFMKMFN